MVVFDVFFKDDSGAALVEYGIGLLFAISVGAFAMSGLALQVKSNFGAMCERLTIEGKTQNECEERE